MTEPDPRDAMVDLAEIRGSHTKKRYFSTCVACDFTWPCTVTRLADELERSRAEVERLRRLLALVIPNCEYLDHAAESDRHAPLDPCPIVTRILDATGVAAPDNSALARWRESNAEE